MNRESVGFAMQNSRFYRAKPTLLDAKQQVLQYVDN